MAPVRLVFFFFFALVQQILSEPGLGKVFGNVKQAAAMDSSISTIEDYRQYLQSIQKIYLKQSYLLPINNYLKPTRGLGLRGGFDGDIFSLYS